MEEVCYGVCRVWKGLLGVLEVCRQWVVMS